MALQRAGRLAEAERAWRALGGQLPNHAGVHANLAMVLWQLGRHDDAEAAAADALARPYGFARLNSISLAASTAPPTISTQPAATAQLSSPLPKAISSAVEINGAA